MGENAKGAAILIRVTPEAYDRWFAEHDGAKEARKEYGITDGPIYRDIVDTDTVLIHLDVEDLERARGWFRDERFQEGTVRAGKVKREILFAQRG